jgi:hypothetical protein
MARLAKVVFSFIPVPGNHTISFSNNGERDAWFDGRDKTEYPDMVYIRQEGIQVDVNLDTARQWNFGYYQNESSDRIYFRVTDLKYINENNTLITIEKDVLLTYLPESTMQPSFIERSNDQPTTIFDNDVPEIQYHGGFTYTQLDFFGTLQEHSYFLQVSGGSEPDDQYVATTLFQPKNFDNDSDNDIVYGSMFRVFPGTDSGSCVDFLSPYMEKGTGDRIVSAGTIPTADVSYSENVEAPTLGLPGQLNAYVQGVRQTKTVSVSTGINTRIAKDNVTIVIAEMDNFANQIEIPITELSGSSIQLVSVSDPISQQRHYAMLSGADGSNELKYRITINTGATLPSMNLPYYMAVRNIETDLGAQQLNNLIGGGSSAISGAATGAAGGAVVGGPAGAIAGAVAGVAGAALSTATSAIQNQVSANAALEKAKRMTPTVSGTPTGFGVFANRAIGVNIFIKEPSGSGLSQLEDYYRFFGYNKSRILTPNVKSGTHFYIGNVNGNFPKASAMDATVIRSLFSSGVWIWEDEGSFFSY